MVTRTAGYALNAVLHIAAQDGPVSAASVAEALDAPSTYLAKILNTLAHEGVLVSERGRHGGFRLAQAPDRVRLLDVVQHFDGMGAERQCLLGRGTCSDAGGCPVHKAWREASTPVYRFFQDRTVADVLGSGAAF